MSAAYFDRIAAGWCEWMTASLFDGTIALALAAVCWAVVRRWASPALGCWLFLLVLVKVAIPGTLPIELERPAWLRLELRGPRLPLSAAAGVSEYASSAREVAGSTAATAPARGSLIARLPAPPVDSPQLASTAPRYLFLGWCGAVLVGLLRLCWLAARGRRVVSSSIPLGDDAFAFGELKRIAGVRASVQLRVSEHLASPAACGLFRPCVLLPRGLTEVLTPSQLRWVLLHELFHIRRGDLGIGLIESLLRVFFFFHPAVWIVGRTAAGLRERACDDAALSVSSLAAHESASGFLRLIEWVSAQPRQLALPATAMFTLNYKNQLKHRLMKLTDPNLRRSHRLGWTARLAFLVFAAGFAPSLRPVELRAEDAAALKEKISALEKRLAEVEQSKNSERRLEKLREGNQKKARLRAAEDRRHYKPEELKEIEALYQVANKNWQTDEARESLKKLLAKYDKANRTGCATLYMGQMSEGQERIEYLTRAVEKFSDCFYFDGCQVGGFGRLILAMTLWESGDKDKARQLLKEIRDKYKDAIDHRGRPMAEVAEAAEKELGITKS